MVGKWMNFEKKGTFFNLSQFFSQNEKLLCKTVRYFTVIGKAVISGDFKNIDTVKPFNNEIQRDHFFRYWYEICYSQVPSLTDFPVMRLSKKIFILICSRMYSFSSLKFQMNASGWRKNISIWWKFQFISDMFVNKFDVELLQHRYNSNFGCHFYHSHHHS